jgi:hypothetical protein
VTVRMIVAAVHSLSGGRENGCDDAPSPDYGAGDHGYAITLRV